MTQFKIIKFKIFQATLTMNLGLNQLDGVLKILHHGCVNTTWTRISAHTQKLNCYEEMNTSSRFGITPKSFSNNFENKRILLYKKSFFYCFLFEFMKLLWIFNELLFDGLRDVRWKCKNTDCWFSINIKLAKSSIKSAKGFEKFRPDIFESVKRIFQWKREKFC